MQFNRRRAARPTQLRFESLENRMLLAGNVKAAISSGVLTLTGDDSANQVQIWQSGTNQWKVQGLGTKINGGSAIKTYNGVQDINVFLRKGNDFVNVFNGALSGELYVDDSGTMSSINSNDVVQVTNVRAAAVYLYTNDGSDNVVVNKVRSTGVLAIETATTTNDGNDAVSILNSSGRELYLATGNGSDSVAINGLTVSQDGASVRTGGNSRDGNDTVSLVNLNIVGTLGVETGAGADTLAVSNLRADAFGYNFGSGNDVATISQVTVDAMDGDAGDGNDTLTFTRITAPLALGTTMGAGNNDRLTVIQCSSEIAVFEAEGNPGDTLVLVQNTFDTLQQSGFQTVIGA